MESNSLEIIDLKSHWDSTYRKAEISKLGWYEENPEPSLQLITKCSLKKNASILNVGSGASTLVDELLKLGYENIIANDLSSVALDKLKIRLSHSETAKVKWVIDDLTKPTKINTLQKIDLWHDRAVLHFFADKDLQDTYFGLVRKLVKQKGFVIIAAFNLNAASKCSGLPVYRYDENMLQERLGNDFQLIEAFDFVYTMPSGDNREYVYTLFKRNE